MYEDARVKSAEVETMSAFVTTYSIFQAVLFAHQYFQTLGYQGQVCLLYSQESSVARNLVEDFVKNWPFPRHEYPNDMALPVTVERQIDTGSALAELEGVVKGMMIEFFWYFGYDLDPAKAEKHLTSVKQHIRIPQELDKTP